jgi:hypothetical protein
MVTSLAADCRLVLWGSAMVVADVLFGGVSRVWVLVTRERGMAAGGGAPALN